MKRNASYNSSSLAKTSQDGFQSPQPRKRTLSDPLHQSFAVHKLAQSICQFSPQPAPAAVLSFPHVQTTFLECMSLVESYCAFYASLPCMAPPVCQITMTSIPGANLTLCLALCMSTLSFPLPSFSPSHGKAL